MSDDQSTVLIFGSVYTVAVGVCVLPFRSVSSCVASLVVGRRLHYL